MGKIRHHIQHHVAKAKGMSVHKIHHHRTSKLTAAVLIASYILLAILGGIMVVDQIRAQRSAKVNPATHSFSNSIVLNINAVKTHIKGQQPFDAPAGKSFVVVDVTITNNRKDNFYFAPVVQTFITDTTKARYEMSPSTLDNPIAAGNIKPASSVGGQLSYLVPENSSGLILHFVPAIPGAVPVEQTLN